MAVTELRSRGERFRGDELNRPHSSLDGLTPYEFATRFGKDHKVNEANL
jgi:putative transposase